VVRDLRETPLRSLIARQTRFVLAASAVVYGIYIAVAPLVATRSSFARPVGNVRLLIGFQKPYPERFFYVLRADQFREFEDADEGDQNRRSSSMRMTSPSDQRTATTMTSKNSVRAGTPN
jgi:hypothetical protein